MGVINTSSHAKPLEKVMGNGINFIGGGQGKLLTVLIGSKERTDYDQLLWTHRKKRKNRLQSIIKQAEFYTKYPLNVWNLYVNKRVIDISLKKFKQSCCDSWLPRSYHVLHHRFKNEKEKEKAVKERSKWG